MAPRLALAFLLAFVAGTCMAKDKDKKKDPDEIGNRDVGKGINFYSIEKEMALGQQLAIEVEKQAKMVDDATNGVHRHLRTHRVAGKAETRHRRQGFRDPSHDRRPHPDGAEEHQRDFAKQTRIRS